MIVLYYKIRAFCKKNKYNHIKIHIEKNLDLFLKELFTLLKVPSVSSQESHKKDMYECAGLFAEYLKKAGTDLAEVFKTDGHPVVYAEKLVRDAKPPLSAILPPCE